MSQKVIPITDSMSSGSGCAEAEPFALRVLGDSMQPEFAEGEIIIVEPAGNVSSGCFVVAVHDDEYTFRQLVIEAGRWFLKPLNDAYPTLEVAGIEAIKGIITQKRHPRRRSIRKSYL